MAPRKTRPSKQDTPDDVGTLWTMRQRGSSARCALLAWSDEWELRVLINGETLLSERCVTADDAFALAKTWKQRMLEHGWLQVVPRATGALDRTM
jgi:hypothetical protein